MTERRSRIDTRTILALMLLLMVLAAGWYFLEQQRAGQRQQVDAIHLNVQCQIAGGSLVNRAGVNVCVDSSGRVIDLPPQ